MLSPNSEVSCLVGVLEVLCLVLFFKGIMFGPYSDVSCLIHVYRYCIWYLEVSCLVLV